MIKSMLRVVLSACGLLGLARRIANFVRGVKDEICFCVRYERTLFRVSQLRRKVKRGGKIRVAFLQMYATSNQDLKIYELMRTENDVFDPFLIVNPDVLRSEENRTFNYDRTKTELIAHYGRERVIDGVSNGKIVDYTDRFDLMTTSNPYDGMAAREFQIDYWAQKHIPIFYASYFYLGRCRTSVDNLRMPAFSLFWKAYVENPFAMQLAKKYQKIHGKNCVLTGSPKMDDYSRVVANPHKRPRVILAPHHSIGSVYPQGGGFLEYAEWLLRLIKMFPNVDFIFRPHPLLYQQLKNSSYWGTEKTEAYWSTMRELPNVSISTGGDYLQLFADSDAMIHDCGSFAAEYLFTGKPCAYCLRIDLDFDRIFTDLGIGCVNLHYPIRAYDEMERFIENVVIAGKDPMKEEREKFAKEKLMFNYPHASEAIVADIKKALGRK